MPKNQSRESEGEKIDLEKARLLLDSLENSIQTLRKLIFNAAYQKMAAKQVSSASKGSSSEVIEGVFNGEEMLTKEGKPYQVPPNYASKSKLVSGDVLKLTIASDGTFIYKQIGPVERQKLVGEIEEKNGKYKVRVNGKLYNVLQASITYFKAKAGDRVTIVIPKAQESQWAAIENIIGK